MSRIRKNYIEAGKVRFVYKHFAILGQESSRSAEASECAAEQEKFWAYHDLIFVDQATRRSTLNDETLIRLAEELNLDTTAFRQCLTSNRYSDLIRQESQVIGSLGVRGTPGFVINGVYMAGAQPYESFAQIIDQQLADLNISDSDNPAPETEAEVEIEGLVTFETQPQTHQEGELDYDHDVPPGGNHNAAWQNCGIYDEPIPSETVVHSLEHGAVWITYQPDLPAGQLEMLRDLVAQELKAADEPMVLLSPQPDQAAPIMATAWQVQLSLNDASDERLLRFLENFQIGPLTPEPGAPCSGGLGEPIPYN